jgi:hypothetical protein
VGVVPDQASYWLLDLLLYEHLAAQWSPRQATFEKKIRRMSNGKLVKHNNLFNNINGETIRAKVLYSPHLQPKYPPKGIKSMDYRELA